MIWYRTAVSEDATRDRRIDAIVVIGLVLGGAQLLRFLSEQYAVDDAWISFRIARNWLEGGGLTYNAGEPPVEGMTNLLWTLLSAAWIALAPGVDPLVGARILGALLFLASIAGATVLAARVAREHGGHPSMAGAATAAVLGTCGSLAYHSLSGLETPLWGFLFVVALLQLHAAPSRPGYWSGAGAALGLLAMTRPEGVAVAGFVSCAVAFTHGGRAWRVVLVAGILIAAMEVFRLAYYGALVPNTFHAKPPDAALGWDYLVRYWMYGLGFVGFIGWLCLVREVPASRGLAVLSVLLIGGTVWSGGDWMMGYRRFTLVTLLAAIGLGIGLGLPRTRRLASIGIAGCLLGGAAAAWNGVDSEPVPPEFMRELGLRAARQTGLSEVALADIGRFGWAYPGPIFDMVGLTDRHIAAQSGGLNRKSWDEAYFRERDPDLVIAKIRGSITDPLPAMPAVAEPDSSAVGSIFEHGGYTTRAFFPYGGGVVFVVFARDGLELDPPIWGPAPHKGLRQLVRELQAPPRKRKGGRRRRARALDF